MFPLPSGLKWGWHEYSNSYSYVQGTHSTLKIKAAYFLRSWYSMLIVCSFRTQRITIQIALIYTHLFFKFPNQNIVCIYYFPTTHFNYLYCCTVHLVDSLIITQPTNALIVCHLFLNNFFKTLSLLLHVSIAYRLSSSGSTYSSQLKSRVKM